MFGGVKHVSWAGIFGLSLALGLPAESPAGGRPCRVPRALPAAVNPGPCMVVRADPCQPWVIVPDASRANIPPDDTLPGPGQQTLITCCKTNYTGYWEAGGITFGPYMTFCTYAFCRYGGGCRWDAEGAPTAFCYD